MKLLRGGCNRIELPDLIIFRILSYLPLRSLFKFKCVCKLWSTLFLHPTFLYFRSKHSPFAHVLSEDAKFLTKLRFDNPETCWDFTTICCSSHFLSLEKKMIASSQTVMYRILSLQLCDALPIPSPQNPSLCITLEFVSITSNPYGGSVKLISVYEDGNNNLGYEILSLDIHVPYRCWRAIDNVLPLPRDGRMMNNIQLFFRRGVAYCIRFVESTEEIDDIQIDIIDMVNETYIGRTTFPRERFMNTTLHLMDWNGRLSFAQLVKDELHVLKLDDHTKLKWAQTKRIIKLHCLKSYHKEDLITFHACDVSTLVFIRLDKKDNRFLCYYNINTGELITRDMYVTGSENTNDDAQLVAYYITQIGFRKAGL
ncbi:hypothetical protein KY290_000208 [Solanum tuberosum]|uniref:F-box domain-containing protein n=1 Tax=Solanum tuberosum TaxID=4113 RepID=A0ABQ7WIN1_SOLTU|nr:hypothetical protein KY290_000208 [Solanum tuberosum]